MSREAVRVVRPVNDRIGFWQSESIRLVTSAERLRQSGRHDPGLLEGMHALLGSIEELARQFEASLDGVPSDVAGHSRIEDTRRALRTIAARLHNELPKAGV